MTNTTTLNDYVFDYIVSLGYDMDDIKLYEYVFNTLSPSVQLMSFDRVALGNDCYCFADSEHMYMICKDYLSVG